MNYSHLQQTELGLDDQLKRYIDEHSVARLLERVASLCFAKKAEHIAMNHALAKQWERAGNRIMTVRSSKTVATL